ncbi:MAG TPA: hypothetical protein VEZ55_06905 [Chitinophagaceae bacterium]|nr:hypothetical protein [Chitinophagaceae bacterium]
MDDIRTMPKDPNKKRFEVHFAPEQALQIEKMAKEQHRSVKNLLETFILAHLEDLKKKKK